MRGAVLYKLGLDFVKDRVMRVSYGTVSRVPFREGYHPVSRKEVDFDGFPRCGGVMHWFAKKVLLLIFPWLRIQGLSLTSGTVIEHGFYSDRWIGKNSSSVSYQSINELWISENDNAPEYFDENGILIAFSVHSST